MDNKDKEQRIKDEIKKCQHCIDRSKRLIEKHKTILKKQEKRQAELNAQLDHEKMNSLLHLIHQGGYDIDSIRTAVSSGSLTDKIEVTDDTITTEIAQTAAQDHAAEERKKEL